MSQLTSPEYDRQVRTNTEVLRGGLEERVLSDLGGLAREGSGSGLPSGTFGGLGLVIETKSALITKEQCASEL